MTFPLVKTDQVPLLVNAISTVDPRTSLTPTTTPPQSIRSTSSPLQAIDLKNTTRPKICGTMAKLLRRRCCIRSLNHVAIRPKAFMIDDEDDDEDTALLTESSSRTAGSSFEIDDSEGTNLLEWG